MNYGYHIEIVSGGFILTHSAPSYGSMSLPAGLPTQTRYVFLSADKMLEFLRTHLVAIKSKDGE